MARTTLILPDERLVALKQFAARRRQSMSAVVDELLREGLTRAKGASRGKAPFSLPSAKLGPFRVNVADRRQLYDFLEDR